MAVTSNWGNENVRQFLLPEQGGVLIAWGRYPCRQCRELVQYMTDFFSK